MVPKVSLTNQYMAKSNSIEMGMKAKHTEPLGSEPEEAKVPAGRLEFWAYIYIIYTPMDPKQSSFGVFAHRQ